MRGEIEAAKAPNRWGDVNYAPVASLRTRVQVLRDKFDEAQLEIADWEDRAKTTKAKPEDYTDEEWADMVEIDALAMPETDRLVVVGVWLEAHGYVLEVGSDGLMRLVRRATA